MEEFFEDLTKFSNNKDSEEPNYINRSNRNNNNIYNEVEFRNRNKQNFYRTKIRNKFNEKMKLIEQNPNDSYVNEVMKSDLANLSKENKELKFCLDSLNKKFETEIKDLKLKNLNKNKEIQSTKQILKQNLTQIKLLESKLFSYEKILKETQLAKGQKNNINENIEEKVLIALKEKEELQKEIDARDEIIKSFKEEVDSKKELFEDIDKMKNDMESYLETMEKLYKEIEKKDEVIVNLKKNMELMTSKHEQEIEKISKNKIKDLEYSSNDEILNEIAKSKDAQIKLTKELIEIQKNYNTVKNANVKLQNLTIEAKDMVKKSIESKNNIKQEYNKAIEELVEKYEKQIQLMKVVIVEQNEKYEKQLEEIKNGKNKNNNNEDHTEIIDDLDINEKNKYLEKLKKENIELIQQNLELKNSNDKLFQKMNQLPELNNKFDEMFEKVKLLKEENNLLKNSLKDSKYLQMINQEHEEEEKEEKENLNKDNHEDNENENENNVDNKKLSLEELLLLESLLKDMEDNNGGEGQPKKEMDINKLFLLENILKKIENKDGEDDKEKENKKEVEENEEEEKNDEELNLKKQLLLEEMLKSLGEVGLNENNEDDKSEENNKENNLNKRDLNNIDNNKPTKIYNKKLLKTSPKIIKSSINKKNTEKSKNDNEEIGNNEKEEENEEEDEEENAPNQINENFNLYKPTKEGMLAFNLANKIYSTTIPNNFEEFSAIFDPETSVQYNTLEGLFIIPSNKSNKLYYYSSKKNIINDLFSLKENHSGGCLFLDNSSKYIIALGGYESKAVEKFAFETGKLEQLPEMSSYRSKISCNQIGNKIYCFFGISKEKPNKSIVECLDLDNIEEGWKEIDFINDAGYDVISGMSCINLNDNELLIIGGLLNDKIPNETLLYFNIEEKKLKKIEKNLPDSDDKVYIFTQNTMFNLFVNGEIISFANIDNNNHVHILDNDLCYDLYLTPKLK